MRRYPDEVHSFIRNNVTDRTTRELVGLVNSCFGLLFTEKSMQSYKKNRRLRSGTKGGLPIGSPSKVFPVEVKDYIIRNYIGIGPTAMTDLLNSNFGTAYSKQQIKTYYRNHGISSGLTGYFNKGNTPPNKGKKGCYAHGCEKGWFSKGHRPINYLPIGTEIVKGDGYLWTKIAEPNCWKQTHRLLWESVNGHIPTEKVLLFADGNRLNVSINNLILISRSQLAVLNQKKLVQSSRELTETGILIADVISLASGRKNEIRRRVK